MGLSSHSSWRLWVPVPRGRAYNAQASLNFPKLLARDIELLPVFRIRIQLDPADPEDLDPDASYFLTLSEKEVN